MLFFHKNIKNLIKFSSLIKPVQSIYLSNEDSKQLDKKMGMVPDSWKEVIVTPILKKGDAKKKEKF